MRDNPCCGYIVAAAELIPALPHEHRAKAEALLEDCNLEALQEFLAEHLPPTLPLFAEAFLLGHDDWSDDLEQGTVYVRFDEEELYTKVETPEMQAFLQAIGKKPQFRQWTMWG